MNKILSTILLLAVVGLQVSADEGSFQTTSVAGHKNTFVQHEILNHLDLGVNIGTTGIGLYLQSPVTKYVKIRAGVDYMPRFSSTIDFGLQAYTEDGGFTSNFSKMQEIMKTMSGYDVDQVVEVEGKPTAFNFKFMVDVYPWADKAWHLTAGFFYGSSKIAKAVNSISEMPSLLAVGIYNRFYDNAINDYYLDNPIYGNNYMDPVDADMLKERMKQMGRLGIHMGEMLDGTMPYIMEPDNDGLVKANVYVNRFKPYLGVGYSGSLPKNKNINIGFDIGVMMWGGAPKIVTHDGVDLARDVINVRGKVGDYVDIISAFKVYPVLNFTISYNLF